jgi:hypothetical protein
MRAVLNAAGYRKEEGEAPSKTTDEPPFIPALDGHLTIGERGGSPDSNPSTDLPHRPRSEPEASCIITLQSPLVPLSSAPTRICGRAVIGGGPMAARPSMESLAS